jgi:hypothetical protein
MVYKSTLTQLQGHPSVSGHLELLLMTVASWLETTMQCILPHNPRVAVGALVSLSGDQIREGNSR